MWGQSKTPMDIAAILRTILRLSVIIAIVYIAHNAINWLTQLADTTQRPNLMAGIMFALIIGYILLISIPFIPGIEIAISLMVLRGPDIVLYIYAATICGLFLAFLAGQYLSYNYLHKVFCDLRLKRACLLLEALEPLSKTDRLELIKDKLPKLLRPFLIQGRYIAIATVLNIPGNAVIGGGGGILLMAGFSRVFSTGWMLLTLCIAAAPIPILILVFNIDPMALLRSP